MTKPFTVLAVLLLAAGCVQLNKTYPEKRFYSLALTRAGEQAASPSDKILRVRRFLVAPQFEGREFVYRTGNLQYESDYYNEWFVSPGALLTEETFNWLAASGLFHAVLDGGSTIEESVMLEGYVTALYGDFREAPAPKAVLELRIHVIEADGRRPRILFHQSYRQAITVADESPGSLVKGWNSDLEQILSAVEEDLRQALVTKPARP
jgi:cholesterol transport system auxiliary component